MLIDMDEEADTGVIKDIAMQFIEDITVQLDSVDVSIREQNFPRIVSAAHTIKGSSATFGLYQVEKIAKKLEACAKGDAHGGEAEIQAALREAFEAGRLALNAYFTA